jgi:nicotinamidase-related amidase
MVTALDTRTALVLIDLQQGIVSRPLAHPREQVLGNVARLVAAFREHHLPVVVVTVDPSGAAGRKPPRVQLSFNRPPSGTGAGIVLAGISTSMGVEGTARSASERGYNLTFPSDAMTDLVPLAHENSIERIFPRLGEIGTADEVIALLPDRK